MSAAHIGALPTANSSTPVKPDPNSLFVRFGERMVMVGIDLLIAVFLAQLVSQYIIDASGLTITDYRPVNLAGALLYFVLFWASPMRATPVQFLRGARVVDKAGNKLGLARALVRGVSLTALIAAALTLFEVPGNPQLGVIVLAAYALLFLAALTPNRQAGHDLLVQSLVVRKAALNSPELQGHLAELVSDNDPDSRSQRKPSVRNIVSDVLVLGIPVIVIYNFALIDYHMDLRSRVSYSIMQTKELKGAVFKYYLDKNRLPANAAELGIGSRTIYPDGGYYELEQDGVIRIRFTVKPELKNGQIILSPSFTDDGMKWGCHLEGDIVPRYLPAACR